MHSKTDRVQWPNDVSTTENRYFIFFDAILDLMKNLGKIFEALFNQKIFSLLAHQSDKSYSTLFNHPKYLLWFLIPIFNFLII